MNAIKAILGLGAVALFFAAIVGWFMNLFTVVGMLFSNSEVTAEVVIRLAGVPIAIIGMIAGWI